MWNNIESLKGLSHGLMWAAITFAVLAAIATGFRYYVDRRASELSSRAQAAQAEMRDKSQQDREAALNAQLEAAHREQQEANAKLTKIEEKTRPRAFNEIQQRKFVSVIDRCAKKSVSLTAPLGDPEAIAFAKYLDSLFKASGWSSSGVSQAVFTGVVMGIILRVPGKDKLHPCIYEVQQAFGAAGIQAPAEIVPGTQVDVLDIVVGHKA